MSGDIPAFLVRKKVNPSPVSGRLMTEEYFTDRQVYDLQNKREPFITRLAERMAHELDKSGAFGPYLYSCRVDICGYAMRAEEQ